MFKPFKRLLFLALTFCFLCCFTAKAEWEEPFGDAFAEQFQLSSLSERITVSMAASDGILYAMMRNGMIYSYDTQSRQYSIVTHVTPWPSLNFDIPLSRQSDETKEAIAEAVTDILVDNGRPATLYGFNKMTGAIGHIDADGIHFQNAHMDTAVFFADDSDYAELTFCQPQIVGEYLKGWLIPDIEGAPRLTWVTFSLDDGSCKKVSIEGAFQLCQLPNNELLAAVLKGNQNVTLEVYDENGQYVRASEITLPTISLNQEETALDLQCIIGPLAYNASTDTLYFIDDTHLYQSVMKEAFEVVDANTPWFPPLAYSKLQTMENNMVIVNSQWIWR